MANSRQLINLGTTPEEGRLFGLEGSNVGLTGTGSTIADALALTADANTFTTVSSSTGAILPLSGNKGTISIRNGGAQPLTVYPQATQRINGGSLAAGVAVANGTSARFFPVGSGWVRA